MADPGGAPPARLPAMPLALLASLSLCTTLPSDAVGADGPDSPGAASSAALTPGPTVERDGAAAAVPGSPDAGPDTISDSASRDVVAAALDAIERGLVEPGLATLRRLADGGDAAARSALGDLHHTGDVLVQDFVEAARWQRLAAAQGHAGALNALGRYTAEGLGVEQDAEAAHAYLLAAAERGGAGHRLDAARFYTRFTEQPEAQREALRWYRLAADQGLDEAQAELGLLYYEGRGVERDLDRAQSLLRQAAEQGHAGARNNLGLMYTRGDGIEQDHAEAARLFALAAGQGLGQAMTNLAVMYENGFGVALDEAEATRLYRLGGQGGDDSLQAVLDGVAPHYDERLRPLGRSAEALASLRRRAAAGDPLARYQLGWALGGVSSDEAISPLPPDRTASARWYAMAAAAGLPEAQLNLAVAYLKGLGVPQDFVQGYRWLIEAAPGSEEARAVRDRLLPQLSADQVNRAQALRRDGRP